MGTNFRQRLNPQIAQICSDKEKFVSAGSQTQVAAATAPPDRSPGGFEFVFFNACCGQPCKSPVRIDFSLVKGGPMLTEIDERASLVNSNPLPACPGCRMVKNKWPGEGYTHDGETYCCQGCAEGTGCMCVAVEAPGFSRRGQRLTRAEPRPGEQRSGAPTPRGELSGERDNLGTEEALDQGG